LRPAEAALPAVAIAAGIGVTAYRWLRVAQREHYLPGEVLRTARRWVATRPPNLPLGAVALTGAGVAVGGAAAGTAIPAAAGAAVGVAAGSAFPIGMRFVGRPPLRWTRRLRTLAGISGAVAVGAEAAVWAAAGPAAAVGVAPAVTVLSIEGGLRVTRPLERRLAARHRGAAQERLARISPRVVAITGSYGKTTIKNHVRDLLTPTTNVVATPASWNNAAGLSRAINEQLLPGTEVFVAEMGTYGKGEIAELTDWVRPDVAVFCALGPVHLERMGSLENIVEAKSEIFRGATDAVIAVDHPLLDALSRDLGADRCPTWTGTRLWRVSGDPRREDVDVRVTAADADPGTLVVESRDGTGGLVERATVPGTGIHPSNVACAVAAALAVGLAPSQLAAGLPSLKPSANRAEPVITDDGLTIIDDTFNSNPDGARAALAALTGLVDGRLAVVTPGMVELGPMQAEENHRFARDVVQAGATLVVVGWTNRLALVEGARATGAEAVTVADREEARAWVRANLGAGDGVLWENDLPDVYP
jgi:UDP-N-acetylmuramoyl-tripeptide--D-alanyl-D-alanine ligase